MSYRVRMGEYGFLEGYCKRYPKTWVIKFHPVYNNSLTFYASGGWNFNKEEEREFLDLLKAGKFVFDSEIKEYDFTYYKWKG